MLLAISLLDYFVGNNDGKLFLILIAYILVKKDFQESR